MHDIWPFMHCDFLLANLWGPSFGSLLRLQHIVFSLAIFVAVNAQNAQVSLFWYRPNWRTLHFCIFNRNSWSLHLRPCKYRTMNIKFQYVGRIYYKHCPTLDQVVWEARRFKLRTRSMCHIPCCIPLYFNLNLRGRCLYTLVYCSALIGQASLWWICI